MNFLKNFLKKYSALLLPAILVLISLLLLIPNMMIAKSLASEMKKSQSQQGQIQNLFKAPTNADAKAFKDIEQKREKEASTIEQKLQNASRRELIMYDFFPKPGDTSFQVYSEFGLKYRNDIQELIRKIRALDAPTRAEIQSQTGVATVGSTGSGVYGDPMLSGKTGIHSPGTDPLVDALCVKRANRIPVYANPDIFAWYSYWDPEVYEYSGEKQALIDSWYSQVAFWVYNDVVDTIESLNSGSNQVNTSPVKRLLGVRFQGKVEDLSGSSGMGIGPSSYPSGRNTNRISDIPVLITDTNPGLFLPFSWTERKSNTNVDVIHFAVSVIVDSKHVMSFYRELSSAKFHQFRPNHDIDAEFIQAKHNQITILESTIQAIDKNDPLHELYRYGDAAVVRADLVCEYIFDRKGFDRTIKENEQEINRTIKPAPIVELESGGEESSSPPSYDF